MWRTLDPDGREVVLMDARWAHVQIRHPYIEVAPEDIVEIVAWPDARMPGRQPNEEWYYRRGTGPSAWIRVVVHYDRDRGVIVTAFPRRLYP